MNRKGRKDAASRLDALALSYFLLPPSSFLLRSGVQPGQVERLALELLQRGGLLVGHLAEHLLAGVPAVLEDELAADGGVAEAGDPQHLPEVLLLVLPELGDLPRLGRAQPELLHDVGVGEDRPAAHLVADLPEALHLG